MGHVIAQVDANIRCGITSGIENHRGHETSNQQQRRRRGLQATLDEYINERQWHHVVSRISVDPRQISFLNWAKKNPLHRVCEQGAPVYVVKCMLRAGADVFQKDSYNRTALHAALSSKTTTNFDVVHLLILSNSQAAQVEDVYGYLPLHKAIEADASMDIIELLLRVYPRGIHHRTNHRVLSDLSSVQALFQKLCLDVRRILGSPLHWACEKGLTMDIEKALDSQYAKQADGNGYYPLHIALQNSAAEKTILKILRCYPQATCIPFPGYDQQMTPLRVVCAPKSRGCFWSNETMIAVAAACNNSSNFKHILQKQDILGKTILHHLSIHLHVPLQVFDIIVSAYPSLKIIKDCDGNTPRDLLIHAMATSNTTEYDSQMKKLFLLSENDSNNTIANALPSNIPSCSYNLVRDESSMISIYANSTSSLSSPF